MLNKESFNKGNDLTLENQQVKKYHHHFLSFDRYNHHTWLQARPSPLPPGKAEKGKRDSLSHFQGPVPGLLKKVHWTAKRPSKQLRSTLLDTSTPDGNAKALNECWEPLSLDIRDYSISFGLRLFLSFSLFVSSDFRWTRVGLSST